MIKKTILFLIFFCMVVACGKKGDPKYEDLEKKAMVHNIIIFKI